MRLKPVKTAETISLAAVFLLLFLLPGCGGDGGPASIGGKDLPDGRSASAQKSVSPSGLSSSVLPSDIMSAQTDEGSPREALEDSARAVDSRSFDEAARILETRFIPEMKLCGNGRGHGIGSFADRSRADYENTGRVCMTEYAEVCETVAALRDAAAAIVREIQFRAGKRRCGDEAAGDLFAGRLSLTIKSMISILETIEVKTEGAVGSALRFDSLNTIGEYATVLNHESYMPGDGDFSLSLWLKLDVMNRTNVIFMNLSGTTNGYKLSLGNTNRVSFIIFTAAGVKMFSSVTAVPDSAWHHLAVVADRDAMLTFYLDGKNAGSFWMIGSEEPLAHTDNLLLGYYSGAVIRGSLDEMAVFGKALDEFEIAREYGKGAGYYHSGKEAGLALLMHLDEGADNTTMEEMQARPCVITGIDYWTEGIVRLPSLGNQHRNNGVKPKF